MVKIIGKVSRIKDNVIAITSLLPIENLDSSKEYLIDISIKRNKKSNQQNKYLWELITEIVKAENGGRCNEELRIDLYTKLLAEAGASCLYVEINPNDYEKFIKSQKFRAYRVTGYNLESQKMQMFCYLGTSQFNTKEMSDFIDHVLDYASQVGIYSDYWRDLLSNQ